MGLVLASLALNAHPPVMIPLLCYNLVQHVVAGAVDWLRLRKERPVELASVPLPGAGERVPLRRSA